MGLTGPDRGKGGTYIIVPPGHDAEDYAEPADFVFPSRTNKLSVGFSVMNPGRDSITEFLSQVKIYPLGSEPVAPRYVMDADVEW